MFVFHNSSGVTEAARGFVRSWAVLLIFLVPVCTWIRKDTEASGRFALSFADFLGFYLVGGFLHAPIGRDGHK